MLRTLLLMLAVTALSACRREVPLEVESRAESARALESRRSQAVRIADELAAARQHLEQPIAPPSDRDRRRCPDDVLSASPLRTAPLGVRVRDARAERRELLPLRFSAALESDEFAGVVAHLAGGRAALWDSAQARARTETDGRAALGLLAEIRARRYRAELLVDRYSAPRLFRRKDKPRSEWAPGALSARLVVADLVEPRALCQALIDVKGDATGEPISKRLREVTRERLLTRLNERVWREMGAALAGVSSVLRLPADGARDAAAHRWAAPPEPELRVARVERD